MMRLPVPNAERRPKLRHRLEAAILRCGIGASGLMGPVAASNVGGGVARILGRTLATSRIADRNLRLAMPELDQAARRRIVGGVWENLGRTVAELPHLAAIKRTETGPGWECEDDSLLRTLKVRGGPAILFSAHLANWEIGFPVATQLGLSVSWFYRAASNPLVDGMIQRLRQGATDTDAPMFAKGATGARAGFAHLRRGGILGMLVDQKLNEGIPVPFFGRPAMTTTALAQLALHFRCPVIPIHSVRLGAARFRVICEPPLLLPESVDRTADVLTMTTTMNAIVEQWIRAQPESWLWLHRRWPAHPMD